MKVENSSFTFREGADYKGETFEGSRLTSESLFNASNFNRITLSKVNLSKNGLFPVLNCYAGNSVILERVRFVSDIPTEPYTLNKIGITKLTKNKVINNRIKQPER